MSINVSFIVDINNVTNHVRTFSCRDDYVFHEPVYDLEL